MRSHFPECGVQETVLTGSLHYVPTSILASVINMCTPTTLIIVSNFFLKESEFKVKNYIAGTRKEGRC